VNRAISGRAAPEAPLAGALENLAQSWGLSTCRLPIDSTDPTWFNLLIWSPKHPLDRPWILLESHLDTVSIEGMTIAPFDPVQADGRLYGRGSCDTKASGAAMLWSLREAHLNDRLARPVGLLLTVDEETGKAGIRAFAERQMQKLAVKPTVAIIGEPTLMAPVIAHNGAVRWSIRTHGIAAHSSNPANGRSAISAMVKVISHLESHYIPSLSATHPLTGKAQCSINQITGGLQANMIPALCEIILDRRLVPGEQPSEVLPAVEEHLNKLRAAHSELSVEQGAPFLDPAMQPLQAAAILHWLTPLLRDLNLPTDPQGMPYGTDASNLTEAGLPAVVLGPGDIRQAHTKDEWIALDQLKLAEEFFSRLLTSQDLSCELLS
jgi:acetylornithine deacetylase